MASGCVGKLSRKFQGRFRQVSRRSIMFSGVLVAFKRLSRGFKAFLGVKGGFKGFQGGVWKWFSEISRKKKTSVSSQQDFMDASEGFQGVSSRFKTFKGVSAGLK